jgi:predicted nuclease of predicted toxin-antitoxin system
VKLLFDENLSARLVSELADIYPHSSHILAQALGGHSDRSIWERAGSDGYVLVTKDEDFHRLSVLLGPPPKVIWVRLGNSKTEDIARLLRLRQQEIHSFLQDPDKAFLALE